MPSGAIRSNNKLGCYGVQLDSSWVYKKCFLYVILKLYAKFQFPTMSGTCQKVCGGGVVVVVVWCGGWLKPTLVFSLAQAE